MERPWKKQIIIAATQRHYISIDCNPVEAFDFFFFLDPFLFTFFLGCSSTTSCLLCIYWWMADRGSARKLGSLRTAEIRSLSVNLMMNKDNRLQIQSYISNDKLAMQYWIMMGNTHTNICLDLHLSLPSFSQTGFFDDFTSGRDSKSEDRLYAFNLFCRLCCLLFFFFWQKTTFSENQ